MAVVQTDKSSDYTEPGRTIDLPYFDAGDGTCVNVPGISPLGDCCKTDQCEAGLFGFPGIPDDPDADCAVMFVSSCVLPLLV